MSVNKLKNIWLSTDTAVPGDCSLRNEGDSIFSGLVDVSGQIIFEPTCMIRYKNWQYISLSTADYYMSNLNNGCIYLVTTSSVGQAKVVYLPQTVQVGTSVRFTMINPTGVAVKIKCHPSASTHSVQPSFISTISIPVTDAQTYILNVGESCEIQSDDNRRWFFREGARNNLDNVWNKQTRFDANVGFGGKNPAYAVDISGDINFTGNLLLNGSAYVPGGNLLPLTNTWTGNNTFENYVLIDGTASGVFENTGTIYASAYATLTSSGYMYANQVSGRMVNLYSTSGSSLTMTLPNITGTPHGVWFYLTGDPANICTVNCYSTQKIYTYEAQLSSIQLGKNETVYFQSQVASGNPYWIMFRLSSTNLDQVLKYGTTWSGDNTWNGISFFNSLPRCSIAPSIATQLTNKQYVDTATSAASTALLGTNNVWSGTQEFDNTVTVIGEDTYPKVLSNIVNGLDYDTSLKKIIIGGNYSIVNYDFGGGTWSTDINSRRIILGSSTTQTYFNGESNSFTNAIPTYDGTATYSLGKQLITRGYADTRYVLATSPPALLNSTNTFTNTNSYGIHPQYSGSIQPINSNEYTPKGYVDTAVSNVGSLPLTFTNNTTFAILPTYSGGTAPSSSNLITKSYADGQYVAISGAPALAANNTWSGTNAFNGSTSFANFPTYSGVSSPTLSNQFTTKNYVDGAIASYGGGALLSGNNAWTGTNTFNVNLPTSIQTPTTGTQLITKTYADGAYLSSASGINASNITSGTLADARLSANVLLTSSSLDATKLTGTIDDARLSGNVLLTSSSLNASNLTSGTLPDARLSANVVLTSGNQTINGAKLFGDNIEMQANLLVDGAMTLNTGSTLDNQGVISNSYQYKNLASQWNSAYITYTTNTTIPTTVSGRILNASGTGPITLTLPSITTGVGYWYNIIATGYDCTLAASGTNKFLPDNSSTAVIPAGYAAMVYEGVLAKWAITLMQRLPSVDTSTAQTIAGVKTFSSAPVMSGASITASTIPTSAISGYGTGFVDTSTTQTIGGAKTFSTAPVMSGASITASTIPTSAISGYGSGFVDTSTTQTIGGTKTFSTRISGSISQAYVAGTTGLTGQRLVVCGTIGTDNTLRGSSTLTYDQTTDTLNATNVNSTLLNTYGMTFSNDTSYAQVVIGRNAAYSNEGVSIGYSAGQNLTSSSDACIAIGRNAMLSASSSALQDTAIGHRALEAYTNGNNNTGIGSYALLNLKYGASNTGVGAAAGGGIVGTNTSPCGYNFAMGESSLSNSYQYLAAWCQYTAASSGSVSSFTPANINGTLIAGRYAVTYGGGATNRVNVSSYNTSTTVIGLSSAVPIDQNVWIYMYDVGTVYSGGYSGATISTPTTTITIPTGLSIAAGNRFTYLTSSGNTQNFAIVSSYNSGTGQLVLTTSITIFALSTFYWFDMNESAVRGNNINNCVALGKYAQGSITTNVNQNTVVGVNAMNGGSGGAGYDNITYLSGSNNTAFGANAGNLITGISSNNTFIGCNTNVSSRILNNINNSTAIGYNAVVSASNQIVIGTATENTIVPGTFSATNSYANTSFNIYTGAATTINVAATDTGETFTVGSTAGGVVQYQLPTSPPDGTNYRFQNFTAFRCSILCGGSNTFAQNNQSTTEIRLGASNFSTVELVYNTGQWYPVGGMYDVVRQSKLSFVSTGSNFGFGSSTAAIHYPFAVSGTTITGTVTLATPTYGTHLVSASAATTITLPGINSAMVGHKITFRKTGSLATVISVTANATPAGQVIIVQNNVTTVAAGTTTQIMSGTQAYGEIICLSTTQWAIL